VCFFAACISAGISDISNTCQFSITSPSWAGHRFIQSTTCCFDWACSNHYPPTTSLGLTDGPRQKVSIYMPRFSSPRPLSMKYCGIFRDAGSIPSCTWRYRSSFGFVQRQVAGPCKQRKVVNRAYDLPASKITRQKEIELSSYSEGADYNPSAPPSTR
jgi:hypothetical protein